MYFYPLNTIPSSKIVQPFKIRRKMGKLFFCYRKVNVFEKKNKFFFLSIIKVYIYKVSSPVWVYRIEDELSHFVWRQWFWFRILGLEQMSRWHKKYVQGLRNFLLTFFFLSHSFDIFRIYIYWKSHSQRKNTHCQ